MQELRTSFGVTTFIDISVYDSFGSSKWKIREQILLE